MLNTSRPFHSRRRSADSDQRPPPGVCPVSHERPASAGGARPGQSLLAASFRPRARADVGDFGVLGESPSHPELLDWLADEFMAGGWKLKRLQRLIVTSRGLSPGVAAPRRTRRGRSGESLLGRMPVRRLEAETIRDALLALSGRLSNKPVRPSGSRRPRRRRPDRRRHRYARLRRSADGQSRAARRRGIPPQHLRAGAALDAAGNAGTVRRAGDDAELPAAELLRPSHRSRS